MTGQPRPQPLVLRRHADPAEFARLVLPGMSEAEAANCLQLGLIDGMLAGQFTEPPPYLATISRAEQEEPLLSAMQTPPYRLILGEPSRAAPDPGHLLEPLLTALPADLPGVLGPVDLSREFVNRYADRHGVTGKLMMSERVYQCRKVTMPNGVPGRLVRATEDHRDLLVRWWRAFRDEAVPHEPDRAEASVQRDLNATVGGLWLWEVDGELVAFAGARGPTPSGIRIGPVYTPPEKRRNGYAAALVGSLTQELLDQGRRFVFLFTNLANPTANDLYQRLGYEGVADRSMYDFIPRGA